MKKFSKICLIIVGILLGIGILLCGISSWMGAGMSTIRLMANEGELDRGKWHINSDGIYYDGDYEDDYDWDDMEENTDEEAGDIENTKKSDASDDVMVSKYAVSDIKKMDMDIGAAALVITTGTDADHVIVTMENGDRRDFEAEMDGNTLEIAYGNEHMTFWLVRQSSNHKDAKIIIEIPAGMKLEKVNMDIGAADVTVDATDVTCGELCMDVGAASIKMNALDVTELLDVSVGAGSVEMKGGTYQNANIECGVGNFEMSGTVDGNLTAECGMGNTIIKLNGNEDDYNYVLSCGMGSLTVNHTKYADIAGEYEIENDGAVGTIDLECGMGNLELEIQ